VKKQVGNISVERHEATNCGDAYVVYLSVRTSTVDQMNLTAADARDLVYGLQWALGISENGSGEVVTNAMRNEVAYRLGKACWQTMQRPESDEIDRGLVLLKNLNEAGFTLTKRNGE
jgi:hypothetical protein